MQTDTNTKKKKGIGTFESFYGGQAIGSMVGRLVSTGIEAATQPEIRREI